MHNCTSSCHKYGLDVVVVVMLRVCIYNDLKNKCGNIFLNSTNKTKQNSIEINRIDRKILAAYIWLILISIVQFRYVVAIRFMCLCWTTQRIDRIGILPGGNISRCFVGNNKWCAIETSIDDWNKWWLLMLHVTTIAPHFQPDFNLNAAHFSSFHFNKYKPSMIDQK